MTSGKKRSGPIDAVTLMEQLKNDPEFQRKKQAAEAKVLAGRWQ